MKDKGPTRAQLAAQNARLQTRIAYLEGQLTKARAGDTVRKEGEHWYELLDLFDPKEIRALPKSPLGRTFFMGMLNETFVLEYPAGTPPEQVREFMRVLRSQGFAPCLAVQEGVRFLKLGTVDADTEQKLDEEVRREEATSPAAAGGRGGDAVPDGAAPNAASARSELHGDGLGGGGPLDGEYHRGGRYHDEEGEGDRAPDGSAG